MPQPWLWWGLLSGSEDSEAVLRQDAVAAVSMLAAAFADVDW